MYENNNTTEMFTAEDLQNFGFSHSMAYAFLNREDVPVIRIVRKKFIRKEKFLAWIENQERTSTK